MNLMISAFAVDVHSLLLPASKSPSTSKQRSMSSTTFHLLPNARSYHRYFASAQAIVHQMLSSYMLATAT